jgi:hypothetical protein
VLPEQLAEWERQIKDVAGVFVSELALGRGRPVEWAQSLATGQVWVADKARERGLIDEVASFDEAMRQFSEELMSDKDQAAAVALAEEQQARAVKAEKERDELQARVDKLQAELTEVKTKASAPKADAKDPLAGLTPEARALVEKSQKEVAAANERIAKLEARERGDRFAKEAAAVGAPKEFAEVLDELEAAAGAEAYAKLSTQLQAYHAQVEQGALFSEKGTAAVAADSPMGQLEAHAKKILADGGAKEYYEAFAKACELHPDLMAQAKPAGKEA